MALRLPDIVDWLRQSYALPDLGLAADGSCTLQFGPLEVGLVPYERPAGFSLRTRIGEVAREDFELRLEALLRANLFTDGVGTSAFGMEPDGGILLTQRFNGTHLEQPVFIAALERFVRHGLHWQAQLAHAAGDATAFAHADLPSSAAQHAAATSPEPDEDSAAWQQSLAQLLDAQASEPDAQGACTLRLPEGSTVHLRRVHRPAVAQVAVRLGEGFASTRDQLLTTLMLSNRFLPEHADPYFALAHQGRDVVLCKAFRIEGPRGPAALQAVAQAIGDIARIAGEFKARLASQGLLAA